MSYRHTATHGGCYLRGRMPIVAHSTQITFYELNGDTSNWCGPNVPAVESMLRTVGFRRVESKAATACSILRLNFAHKSARVVQASEMLDVDLHAGSR